MQLGKLEDFWETDEDLVAEDVGREVHTRLGLFGEGSLTNERCHAITLVKDLERTVLYFLL